MDEIVQEQLHVTRVAALGVGQGTLEVRIRVPSETSTRRRAPEVRSYGATKRQILSLPDWLRSQRVHKVVMEATGDYVRSEGAWDEVGDAVGASV